MRWLVLPAVAVMALLAVFHSRIPQGDDHAYRWLVFVKYQSFAVGPIWNTEEGRRCERMMELVGAEHDFPRHTYLCVGAYMHKADAEREWQEQLHEGFGATYVDARSLL